MSKFWCGYCGAVIKKNAAGVKHDHLCGKKHKAAVELYWELVARESRTASCDQTEQLDRAFAVPGLTPNVDSAEVEARLDTARLPEPIFLEEFAKNL